jgi:hypothetical protein
MSGNVVTKFVPTVLLLVGYSVVRTLTVIDYPDLSHLLPNPYIVAIHDHLIMLSDAFY